jgi:wobble nucleotide-excising tRNase
MDRVIKKFNEHWQWVFAIGLFVFNVGYTVAQLEDKPSKEEVKKEIDTAIEVYDKKSKEGYIKIEQVPGLLETIISINDKLKSINERMTRIETKIYK